MNNAILISLTNGVAGHQFCTAAEARKALDAAAETGGGASALFVDDGSLNAEDVYSISPDLQNRVSMARQKLQDDWRIKLVLDKHQVPEDRDIRKAVYAAIKELRNS